MAAVNPERPGTRGHGGAYPWFGPAGGEELAGEKPADWSLALCGGGYERDPARMTITGRQPTSGTWHGQP